MTNRTTMFDLRGIPIVRVLIPFLLGVVGGGAFHPGIHVLGVVLISLLLWALALLIFHRLRNNPGHGSGFFSLLLFMLFSFTGLASFLLTRPEDPCLPVDKGVMILVEIEDEPRSGISGYTFDLKLHLLYTGDTLYAVKTRLRAHCRIASDSVLPQAGETWQFLGRLSPITESRNPGAPDYRAIMGRKECWYHFYPESKAGVAGAGKPVSLRAKKISTARMRNWISGHWHGGTEEVSLLKAVCLGDRSSLSMEMREAYASAGGMHLLAVSGLHVGLIWWVLQRLTGWMTLIFRSEKQRTAAVVGILWVYASLTGFSSSVCRSVTMFTFFSVSQMMGQRSLSLNGILVSAFLLLLVNPQRLTDVGFQLSYLAILGIVSFHPVFRKIFRVKNRLLRWAWEATSVSLSAQLSTAPLLIYYFHQLPLYALLTNLFAVPLLSILIAIFVCSVPLTSAGILEEFFNLALLGLARLMNLSMECISSLPGAVVDGLLLDRVTLLLFLLLLLLAMICFQERKRLSSFLMVFLTAAILVWSSCLTLKRRASSELLISHFRAATMVSIGVGKRVEHYCWYRDSSSMSYMKQYRDLKWNRRVFEANLYEVEDTLTSLEGISFCMPVAAGTWMLGTPHVRGLVVREGMGRYSLEMACGELTDIQGIKSAFILLSGEPPLAGRSDSTCFRDVEIVLDGSNRSWYIDRWSQEANPVHVTDRKGAFVKRW